MYFIILLLFILVPSFLLHCLNTLLGYHPTVEVPEDSTQTQVPSSSGLKLDQEIVPTNSTINELVPSSSSSAFNLEELLPEPSSSRSSLSWTHDVFLSFRGEDTRNGFTGHLNSALRRKGIHTFRDTEGLQKGDSIAPELLKEIEESQSAVIILSRNYADSKWCLDELAYVLSCKETRGLRVFPVFYHVEPSEIRNQTGEFGRPFVKHEKAFKNNTCKVDNWRQALKKVADVSGWNAKDREEAEVVEEIAKTISHLLKRRSSSCNKELVGMDARVEAVMSYLDLESNEVLTVGIWGMGGIGKTTLANEVYQKIHNRFHTSGFVRNVREQSQVELQKLVCESFFGDGHVDTVKKGSTWSRLSKKKVLLVLDDVDDFRQIERLVPGQSAVEENFWGPGSRLIITTRDRRILTASGVQNDKIYEVEKLNDEEASQLLCRKAFKNVNPPTEFAELTRSFLRYASGLPLAHEVLGSHLSGRSLYEWAEVLDRLDKDLNKDIFNVLQVSYDGLEDMDQQIFLDIACFFNGEDYARVEKILKGCGFSSRIGINILVDKCLVKIERDKLWMHDLLRCLGWHIVRRESPDHPGNRSRLWLDDNEHKHETTSWRIEDARNVLTENTGTTAVKGLFLSLPEKEVIRLNSDPFLTMSKLRLLKICNVNFQQDVPLLQYPSKDLRLLEWHECPLESLSSWFSSRRRLVEIKIPNSRIQRLWDVSVYQLDSLTHMDLSNCQCLTMTPDFSVVPNLETLILEGCTKLSEVHWSTMFLQHLVLLNLKGCVSLEGLPSEIELRCLRTFVLSGCTNLSEFPFTVGHMDLIELFLDGTAIEHLLGLSRVYFRRLTFLNLSGCKNLLERPVYTITGMTSLKFLYLSSCSRMEALPEGIELLQHLEELDVCDTPIIDVPDSILSLKNLKLLCFHGCSKLHLGYLSPGLMSLTSLTTLNLGGCNLENLDIARNIGNLSSLQSLDLSENRFSIIPDNICQLPELREISLRGCDNLESLPVDPPASAQNVDIRGCTRLTNCSDSWQRLASDEGLRIRNCGRWDDRRPLMSLSVQFDEFHETPYP